MKTVFYNGTILTMEEALDFHRPPEAVLVEDGRIRQVGSKKELLTDVFGQSVSHVDLEGQTLLPAFLDAHSHLSAYASSFLEAPLGEASSFDEILEKLKLFADKNNCRPGQWIIGSGYDHNNLKEKRHPTRQLLDQAFPCNPVLIQHASRHFGVFNSAGLAAIQVSDPSGSGYLDETALVEAVKKVPMASPKQLFAAYQKAQQAYASYGITTIQEGMMVEQMIPLYRQLLDEQTLTLDVVGYPQAGDWDPFEEAFPGNVGCYDRHFRLGGMKIILDGSPQGRTAFMRTPYLPASASETAPCYGVSSMTTEAVKQALQTAMQKGVQLLAHCNGDAAAEQFLSCAEALGDAAGVAAIRPVLIHAQLLALDQLPRVKALGILPSFFIAHCYHWGDVHIRNFGLERASRISPLKSAQNQGILFTFHQDTPVIEPDMPETIWCAVNRRTKSGILLGADERISVYEALKAVTIHGACQYGEENQKGSILPGKQANFAVLDRNPLTVPKEELNRISVTATYQAGQKIR